MSDAFIICIYLLICNVTDGFFASCPAVSGSSQSTIFFAVYCMQNLLAARQSLLLLRSHWLIYDHCYDIWIWSINTYVDGKKSRYWWGHIGQRMRVQHSLQLISRIVLCRCGEVEVIWWFFAAFFFFFLCNSNRVTVAIRDLGCGRLFICFVLHIERLCLIDHYSQHGHLWEVLIKPIELYFQ